MGEEEPNGWPAQAWAWWTGLSDVHAWQEIGAFLVPALVLIAIIMFWGIRRMHMGE